MSPSVSKPRQSGFTLVELLVALALGLLLSLGISNIYLESRRSYAQDEEVARLQENARYALRLLKRDLTMSGFMASIPDYSGIASAAVDTDCVASGNWALDVSGDVFELINEAPRDGTLKTQNDTTLSCLDSGEIVDRTDIITIKRTADRPTLRNGDLTITGTEKSAQWYLRNFDGNSDLSMRYIATGEPFPDADKASGSKVDYWEYFSRVYFIRDHSRTAGDDIPTLCMAHLQASDMTTECIVEGIEDMQIEVGVDTEGDDSVPDLFISDPSPAQIEQAVVVRVYLLVRSVNELPGYTNEKSYNLGSKTVNAKNDGFVRRVFSTTVQMRNAKLPNA